MLTNVCRIQYGYAFDSSLFSENQGLPLVRIRDVVRGFSETYTIEKCGEEYTVHNGDMLIGMDGEFNIAKWRGGDALLNQRVCKLIPTNRIDAGYLFYFMPSALKAIEAKTPFVTVKHLSAKELNKVKIPMLPLVKQREIAKIMDSISAIIVARQQQLTELDNLIKARFVELFGDPEINPHNWEKVALSEIITTINNGMTRRGNDDDGNIVLRLMELQEGRIDYSSVNRIKLKETEKTKFLLKESDFLFARVNGNPDYVGRCAVFTKKDEPIYHNDHIIRVHCKDDIFKDIFGSYLFNSDYGKSQIRQYISTSAGQFTINQTGLSSFIVILPPIELQNEFGDFVKQTDKSKVAVQKALDETKTLFDSLMQEYFG